MSDKKDIPQWPLDVKYTLQSLQRKVFVLLEWGGTYTGDPEVVGVYNSEEALALGFSNHIEEYVSESTMPLAVAYLLKKGNCCVKDLHFSIWETDTQEIVVKNDEKEIPNSFAL